MRQIAHTKLLPVILLPLCACMLAGRAFAADAPTTQSTPPRFKLPFKPSAEQAAAKDIGALSRCKSDPSLYVIVLAQREHVGWTMQEQPTLIWYLSKATDKPASVLLRPLCPDGKDT